MFTKHTLVKAGALAVLTSTFLGTGALNASAAADPLAPIAVKDSFLMTQDRSFTISPTGLLDNDASRSGDRLFVAKRSLPRHGSLTSLPDGSLTYTPHPGYAGEDQITYQAGAGSHRSTDTKVLFTISPKALAGSTPLVVVGEDGSLNDNDRGATFNIAVFDQDSAPSTLKLSASSSNQALVPTARVKLTGGLTSRQVAIDTVAGKTGTAVVTIKVSDGKLSSTTPITVKVGGGGADTLTGTEGADLLVGGANNDKLDGKGGNDTLMSGTGIDQMLGGSGADHFKVDGTAEVRDLNSIEGDRTGF